MYKIFFMFTKRIAHTSGIEIFKSQYNIDYMMQSAKRDTRPIVFLLDFDGTIVGNVHWLVVEKNLLSNMATASQSKVKYMTSHILKDLRNGLIRPYFKYFMTTVKRKYPNAEFFIYTASEKKWAEFIIPKVERAVGVKFNRPILTRDNCAYREGYIVKSLDTVRPIISKRLQLKYGSTDMQSLVLVDNTRGVLAEHKQQITCPTYDMDYPIDVLRQLPESASIESVAHSLTSIHGSFKPATPIKNSMRFWSIYHRFLGDLYYKAYKNNKKSACSKDLYWKQLANILIENNISNMSSYELKELGDRLQYGN